MIRQMGWVGGTGRKALPASRVTSQAGARTGLRKLLVTAQPDGRDPRLAEGKGKELSVCYFAYRSNLV